MEDTYQDVGLFYDEIVGDRAAAAKRVGKLIRKHAPGARTVLEVACGTGSILQELSSRYQVTGLDFSETMLVQASEKCPEARLFKGDMRSFDLESKFDVLICLSDSINHLLNQKDWKKAFRSFQHHLESGGLCIFDVNTPYKLEQLSKQPPIVHEFDEHTMILDVEKQSKNRFDWNVRIFAPVSEDLYACVDQAIPEAAFSITTIRELLKPYFTVQAVVDAERAKRSRTSNRLYFICQAK